MQGVLDERSRRLVAAAESKAIGRGGVSVARATGMSRQVIRQGMAELSERPPSIRPVEFAAPVEDEKRR